MPTISSLTSPRLRVSATIPTLDQMPAQHLLVVIPKGFPRERVLASAALSHILTRQKSAEPPKVVGGDAEGHLLAWVEIDLDETVFQQQTLLRKAVDRLFKESPRDLAIVIPPSPHESSHAAWRELACRALFVAAANGQYELGKPPGKTAPRHLQNIHLFGIKNGSDCADALALAGANLLARSLTLRPANDLTPKQYRADIATLAKQQGWQRKEYPYATLRKMGAGAFCAVAQGSDHTDAAIVHLSYRPTGAKSGKASPIALIGKGICMDTGGHGLKPAKSMYGMHEDMAGSAVVLGIMAAATAMKLPVPLDAWLAISQNHIGPKAYHPGDVVTALNGTTIEVVHTDAEGRMVLADTLTLAARQKPRAMIDFATLTGAMVYALGTRQCGIFTNREALAAEAVTCGQHSGERISVLPLDADYDEELESKVADVKQCLIAGEADAIYAARFLHRFVDNTPWVHLDLSAYRHDGGLGAIAGDVNGFGVAWGVEMVRGVKQ